MNKYVCPTCGNPYMEFMSEIGGSLFYFCMDCDDWLIINKED